MAYEFYLDGEQFPVAPSKITNTIDNKNEVVELINQGDVNILKSAGLQEVSFTVLLPNVRYPFAEYPDGFHRASYYLDLIEECKADEDSHELLIARRSPKGRRLSYINLDVSLEDYKIVDDADEDGIDISVTLNFKEYVSYGTKTVNLAAYIVPVATTTPEDTAPAATTTAAASTAKSYTIASGDTLCKIAKQFYGDSSKYPSIYNANSGAIEAAAKSHGKSGSSNGHWIYPGTVLTIP